jgi:hypothetical protein
MSITKQIEEIKRTLSIDTSKIDKEIEKQTEERKMAKKIKAEKD